VGPQDKLKAQYQTRALLYTKQLNPHILEELSSKQNKVVPIKEKTLDKPIGLINRILTTNRTAKSLKALRD